MSALVAAGIPGGAWATRNDALIWGIHPKNGATTGPTGDSDFPYCDSTWPHSRDIAARDSAGVPDAEWRAMISDGCALAGVSGDEMDEKHELEQQVFGRLALLDRAPLVTSRTVTTEAIENEEFRRNQHLLM